MVSTVKVMLETDERTTQQISSMSRRGSNLIFLNMVDHVTHLFQYWSGQAVETLPIILDKTGFRMAELAQLLFSSVPFLSPRHQGSPDIIKA